jgi:hypothetical protein
MKAATEAAVQTSMSVIRYGRIGFILASAFLITCLRAEDPPANLMKRIIERETETERVQANYTYRQTVTVEEFDPRGIRSGEYKEVRDVIFSPAHERTEQVLGAPKNSLKRLLLTEEDFRDLREVQPFLLTKDQAFIYETRFRGEETIEGKECWLVQIKPRQILQGQRLFVGMLWVDKGDFSIVRSEGEAVPQIRTMHSENLFPRFTTVREKVEGGFWFPTVTSGDDTLQFRTGPQRMKLTIRYSEYRKFGADSKILFGK